METIELCIHFCIGFDITLVIGIVTNYTTISAY